jgi:hypothetical protein
MTGVPGTGVTTRPASALVAWPAELLITTLYWPASPIDTAPIVRIGPLAPAIGTPLRRHWKASGPLPLAATASVAVWPTLTTSPVGCVAIAGATGCGGPLAAGRTVSGTASDRSFPPSLLTATA